MSSLPLVLSIVGSMLLVTTVLFAVFAAIRKAIDRAAEALGPEGIELDSGPVIVSTRMRNFRAPKIYSSAAFRRNPARVVLTKQRLYILERPQRFGLFDRSELSSFTVRIVDGTLHLRSEEPPGATGTIEYRVPVRDADTWLARLVEAGARRVDAP